MIRGWQLPDDGRPWYPIDDYPQASRLVPVELACEGSMHVVGRLGTHEDSGKLFWWERRESGQWAVLAPWRKPGSSAKRYRTDPYAWRPLEGKDVPSVIGLSPFSRPTPVAEPAAEDASPEPTETDDWPFPGMKLTLDYPPCSAKECEARVLRAWRTHDSLRSQVLPSSGGLGSWPVEWYQAMRLMADDSRDHPQPGSERRPWLATRRDVGDWDVALGWYSRLPRDHRRLIRLRAASPAYSWRTIAEMHEVSVATVRQRYADAVAQLYVLAKQGKTDRAS